LALFFHFACGCDALRATQFLWVRFALHAYSLVKDPLGSSRACERPYILWLLRISVTRRAAQAEKQLWRFRNASKFFIFPNRAPPAHAAFGEMGNIRCATSFVRQALMIIPGQPSLISPSRSVIFPVRLWSGGGFVA
jgi:hypothetical protein